jgi:hypothetical protein
MSRNILGIGMCIRDDESLFVLPKAMWFLLVCSVDVGEALELYHVIRWINDLQLTNVDFEVDSKRVDDYFRSGIGDLTEFEAIMSSRIQFCSLHLEESHVDFIRKQVNKTTHVLAATTSLSSLCICTNVSTCISDLVANEMS